MKIRNGFVSNSSSSSYVCEVCHEANGGWDACLADIGMTECANGHIICVDHMLSEDKYTGVDNVIPPEECPICQLKVLPDYLFISYVEKRAGINKKSMLEDIKTKFGNYERLMKYLHG